eukprot:1669273-Alexandrium_andersonii.AAC.1
MSASLVGSEMCIRDSKGKSASSGPPSAVTEGLRPDFSSWRADSASSALSTMRIPYCWQLR